ncbi:MAG: MFS transporter [Planctomycetota bacterium]|jgi:MFS family permease|nr:MFS transporter [Planctomycetota bacterium]
MPEKEITAKRFAYMMFAAFLCYLPMVMPLAILSILAPRRWQMSNFLAGVAVGASFFATFICRKWAGGLADRIGGKRCFIRGCLGYLAGGAVCLGSAWEAPGVEFSFALLCLGRLILGFSESLANVGMIHWCIGRLGLTRAGRMMAAHGMCIYATAAVGGWSGFTLYESAGFAALMGVGLLPPLGAAGIALASPDAAPPVERRRQAGFREILGIIFHLSLPAGLHAVGFAVLGAFLSKTFLDRGWDYASLAFTFCGLGFVCMRLILGHLPDRMGGLPVAAISGCAEMAGLYLLCLAPEPVSALVGAFLTGAGCSMVYPSLSLEVVRKAPTDLRGVCMSCYCISMDMAYCFSSPAAGLIIDRLGGGDDHLAYLMAALAATLGQVLIWRLRRRIKTSRTARRPV